MDNFELFTPEQQAVLNRYGRRCVVCRAVAITIHEEPPKSLNPNWEDEPETWFPVCNLHHDIAHGMTRKRAGEWLRNMKERLK